MAFKRYDYRAYIRELKPFVTVHGGRGQLWFNKAAMQSKFGEARHLSLWYDEATRQCGLRVEAHESFDTRLLHHRQGSGVVTCSGFCTYLGVRETPSYRRALHYDAAADMYVFDGPPRAE